MVTMTIMVVAAAMVLPRMVETGQVRLMAASRLLASDIEMAQVMTITRPNEPVVVRFDGTDPRYWLAYADDTETPLSPSEGQIYEIEFGIGRGRAADGVSIGVSGMPGNMLAFNAQGGLDDPTAQPVITLTHGSRWVRLDIAPTTGTITETTGSN